MLGRQAAQLKTVAGRLEASLKNAAAINARLNQSEARYKGLVDAQGDAIFRRDASSRLTYGNEAFFKPVRQSIRPAPSAIPSRPNRIPAKPRAAVRQLPGVGASTAPAMTSMCGRPRAIAGSPGKISRCAIPMAGWWKCKAWAATSPTARQLEGALTEARDSRRGSLQGQVGLPGHHEPRNPHAHERRAGHGRGCCWKPTCGPNSAPMPKPSPSRARRC